MDVSEIIERFLQWCSDRENLLPLIILGFMLFMFILGVIVFI